MVPSQDYLPQDLQHFLGVLIGYGIFKTLLTLLFHVNNTHPECPPKLRDETSFLPSRGMLVFHSQTPCTESFLLHPG